MELDLWRAVLDLRRELRGQLDALRPEPIVQPGGPPPLPPVPLAEDALTALRARLRALLDRLQRQLNGVVGEEAAYHALFFLVLYCDETVLRRLEADEQPLWPLLQRQLFDIDDGGEQFYRFADDRLGKPETAHAVLEVAMFCLGDGFLGRHADDEARRREYRLRLGAHLREVDVTAEPPSAAAPPTVVPRLPLGYYAIAVAAAVGLPLVWWLWSNA